MKKLSLYAGALALMLAGTFTSCSVEDNAIEDNGTYEVLDNGDALEKAILLYGENGVLDLSGTNIEVLVIPAESEYIIDVPVTIIGNNKLTLIAKNSLFLSSSLTLENVKIDASELNAPVFIMDSDFPTEDVNDKGAYEIENFTLANVSIDGLKNQVFYCNKQKYLIKDFNIKQCNFNYDGVKNKTIFDFNGGGLAQNITVEETSILAKNSSWSNGGFYSTQSGSKMSDLTTDPDAKQIFTIKGNNFSHISEGKTLCTLREKDQTWQSYEIKNNTIENCGKQGQFIVGFNAGSNINKKDNWDVSGNIVLWDGNNIGAAENEKCGIENACIVLDADN